MAKNDKSRVIIEKKIQLRVDPHELYVSADVVGDSDEYEKLWLLLDD